MIYTVGTLFSGIGVPDLCARLLGMETVWQVEKEAFPQTVLRKNFPEATLHGDIFDCHNLPYVDVIVAGFPCQPFSGAGKQEGERDPRYLVPEMLRVINEVRPRICLLENVPGFTSLDDGKSFKSLLGALAEMGLDAEWGHLRASDVGAPHRRERWFCVAHPQSDRDQRVGWGMGRAQGAAQNERTQSERSRQAVGHASSTGHERQWITSGIQPQLPAADHTGNTRECEELGPPRSQRLSGHRLQRSRTQGARRNARQWSGNRHSVVIHLRTRSRGAAAGRDVSQPRLGRNIDGFADRLDGFVPYPARPGMEQYAFEPSRVATRTPDNAKRIMALGNSMAVDVVFEIMHAMKLWLEAEDCTALQASGAKTQPQGVYGS